MKILVTGGAGFIGSCLSERLLQRGDQVTVVDNFNPYYSPARKRANIESFKDNPKFSLYEADFSDRAVVADIFSDNKFDCIAHLGAMANVRYSVKHPAEFVQANMVGTANLLEFAAQHAVDNFVFASTSSVYGQRDSVPFKETDSSDLPLAPYPATKKSCELMGHAYHNMHGLPFTALRFFNVYGPKGRPDMMPYIVFQRIKSGELIKLFDGGDLKRDWTFIDDVVSGIVAALDKPLGYEVLNIGRGEPHAMTEFMEITQDIAGKQAVVESVPAPASEPKITFAAVDKAKQLLGYNPQTSLADGLKAFWDWYSVQPEL